MWNFLKFNQTIFFEFELELSVNRKKFLVNQSFRSITKNKLNIIFFFSMKTLIFLFDIKISNLLKERSKRKKKLENLLNTIIPSDLSEI
jgi:hypothetical protein